MYGPVIEGKLVQLRPPRADDAAVVLTWFEDMEVTRFLLLRHPPSIDAEKEWLDKMARSEENVVWIGEYEGRAVGATAIHQIDWKNGIGTTGTVIGDKAVWGKGLGRELMALRSRYAFTQLPLRKLKSAYLEGNEASARAQAAAGYRVVGRHRADRFVDGVWVDEVITEVIRDDWAKSQPS
ncbi:MAG: GNAT family N-acetyltransferase [Candidatus Dormibacteraeota bacterium]|nr:GNAT family N-acetyltransferase [Candidatus Dormibacteraeota bacterium]